LSFQIDKQRAVQQFRRFASETNPSIQTVLPLAEIVGLLQEGVGNLMREAGLLLMMGVMEEEVRYVVGERHAQNPERQASRWGKENGHCVIDGQKVPIQRTRVRDKEKHEVKLGSYELFQRSSPMQRAVWDKIMRGLSTRNYAPVVKDFAQAYGVDRAILSRTHSTNQRFSMFLIR
jgi:putative transposase